MALAVEVSSEEAGVLGFAVGIHVDMQFAIDLVEVAIELYWEEKRILNGHHRQHNWGDRRTTNKEEVKDFKQSAVS